jgi:hypothetical protein
MSTRQWPDQYCTPTNSNIMHFPSLPNPAVIVHDSIPSMLYSQSMLQKKTFPTQSKALLTSQRIVKTSLKDIATKE